MNNIIYNEILKGKRCFYCGELLKEKEGNCIDIFAMVDNKYKDTCCCNKCDEIEHWLRQWYRKIGYTRDNTINIFNKLFKDRETLHNTIMNKEDEEFINIRKYLINNNKIIWYDRRK